jgi:hypothetical protein
VRQERRAFSERSIFRRRQIQQPRIRNPPGNDPVCYVASELSKYGVFLPNPRAAGVIGRMECKLHVTARNSSKLHALFAGKLARSAEKAKKWPETTLAGLKLMYPVEGATVT